MILPQVGIYKGLQDAGIDPEPFFNPTTEKTMAKKEELKEFSGSLGFIVYFVLLTLFLTIFTGEKPLRYFLYLVLAGMVLVNTEKITSLLRRV